MAALRRLMLGELPLGPMGAMRFPSAAKYGVCAAIALIFVSEYKFVTRKLPVYNLKYETVDYDWLRAKEQAKREDDEAKAAKLALAAAKAAAAAAE